MSSSEDDASPGDTTKGTTPVVINSIAADESSSSDPERQPGGVNGLGPIVDDHEGDLVTDAENRDLKRGLGERHLTMLGIAGAIGTGLFLSLGGAIQTGGPLGALLGYAMVGGIVCAVQFALGEVTALLPVSDDNHTRFALNLMTLISFIIGHWKFCSTCRISSGPSL